MSASTGTIQRPMGSGSIIGAVAIGVVTVFAVGALALGAINSTATKHVAVPVSAPVSVPNYLDRGGRGETIPTGAMPYAAPKLGNVTPRFDTLTPVVGNPAMPYGWTTTTTPIGKTGNVTPRFDALSSAAATHSAGAAGYLSQLTGSGHAAPLLDRNAENVVVTQRGPGKHAE
jgi:hypothetical protein